MPNYEVFHTSSRVKRFVQWVEGMMRDGEFPVRARYLIWRNQRDEACSWPPYRPAGSVGQRVWYLLVHQPTRRPSGIPVRDRAQLAVSSPAGESGLRA